VVKGYQVSKVLTGTELHWQVSGGRQKSTKRLCKMNKANIIEEVREHFAQDSYSRGTGQL
jgi:hypothetical protein